MSDISVLSGEHVDLIYPFPASEVHRTFGWSHCYRTLAESDDVPASLEGFTGYMQQVLQAAPAWGIIDKYQTTNQKHEAPLVGMLLVEPSVRSALLHFGAGRRAFKHGLVDEAADVLIRYLFESAPLLLRIGAYVDDRNSPAKTFFRRLGFSFEGVCKDSFIHKGEPQAFAYFGLTRRSYEAKAAPPEPTVAINPIEEPPSHSGEEQAA